MDRKPLRHVDLYSDIGRLEALYRDVENPRAIAIVCHPLTSHGGTLHNKVVFRAARGFESANVATLRFNFRGAGGSGGSFEGGNGEVRDVAAAIEWVRARHADIKLIVGGFSFGSWVSSRVACERPDVAGVFLIGTPVNKYDFNYLTHCDKPMFFLHGSKDEHGDADKVEKLVNRCRNAESLVVTDADHFFGGQLDVVEQAIRDWCEGVLDA